MEASTIERLLSPPLDKEMKHYLLLAYVQRTRARFADHKLYPHLDRLAQSVHDLRAIGQQQTALEAAMPKVLDAIDLRRMRLRYLKPSPKPEGLLVIEEVIAMALPQLAHTLALGRELRDELAHGIRFTPIGLLPLNINEGYLMLRQGQEARVYSYALHAVRTEDNEPAHVNLTTRYVSSWTLRLSCTYEHIKHELVRSLALPNPATFAFEAPSPLPPVETFLPLAKQLVYAEVVRNAA